MTKKQIGVLCMCLLCSNTYTTYSLNKNFNKQKVELNSQIQQKNKIIKKISKNNKTINKSNIKLTNDMKILQQKLENTEDKLENAQKKIYQSQHPKKNTNTKWYKVKVTYYTNSVQCCGKTDGVGASGKKLTKGDCALPKQFPFGFKIYIEGLNQTYNCYDRGGAIHFIGKDTFVIDIYVPNITNSEIMKTKKTIWTRAKIVK